MLKFEIFHDKVDLFRTPLSLCSMHICHDLKQNNVSLICDYHQCKQTTQLQHRKICSQHVTALSTQPWINYSTFVRLMRHCFMQLIKFIHIIIFSHWHDFITWCCRCLHLVWIVYLKCWKWVRIVMALVTSAKLLLEN